MPLTLEEIAEIRSQAMDRNDVHVLTLCDMAEESVRMREALDSRKKDSAIIKSEKGNEHFMEERAIAQLLATRQFFVHTVEIAERDSDGAKWAFVLAVNANDYFGWACADIVEVCATELEEVYRAWQADKEYGIDLWACIKRKCLPQEPIIMRMKAKGSWNHFKARYDEAISRH